MEMTLGMFAWWLLLLWGHGILLGLLISRGLRRANCHKNPVRFFVVEIGEDEPIPKKQNGNQTE